MNQDEFISLVKVILQIQKDIKEIKTSISSIEKRFDNLDIDNTVTEEQISEIQSQVSTIERKERIRDGRGTLEDHEIERLEVEYKVRNCIFDNY